MISGFSKKKIKSQKSLGELLLCSRKKKEISLEEAELATKVKLKYLKALEEGNWNILPLDVYVRGFVLSYSKFLGIDKKEVLSLFEVEKVLKYQKHTNQLTYKKSYKDIRFLITPRVIASFVVSLFVMGMVGYIIFQVSNFAGMPALKIINPQNNTIVESDSIDISGLTDPDAVVMVNEERVPVTEEGRFNSSLKLHRGVNVLKVKAINKTKKEAFQIYTVEYKPKTAQAIELLTNQ